MYEGDIPSRAINVVRLGGPAKMYKDIMADFSRQRRERREGHPIVIGLCGFAKVGKDTIADILVSQLHYEKRAFADRIREFALAQNAYLPEVDSRYVDLINDLGYEGAKRRDPCVRAHLVDIGRASRQTYGVDVLIDATLPPLGSAAHTKLLMEGKSRLIVVSDCRSVEEANRIHDYGGVVCRIHRPGCDAADATEARTIPYVPCDVEFTNDCTVDELPGYILKLLPGVLHCFM